MVCKHYVQVPLLVYLLAVVEVELPHQFPVAAEAINPALCTKQPCQKWQGCLCYGSRKDAREMHREKPA
jgi:hypothetical protein